MLTTLDVSSSSALKALCASPRLYVAENFATEAEIEHVLRIASDEAGLAARGIQTRRGVAGLSFEMPVRGDPVLEGLTRRTYGLVHMGNDMGETLRFRRYLPGERHPAHLDTYTVGAASLILTALLYLTDTEEGGETYFPNAKPSPIHVPPRRGRLAVWFNYTPDGQEDEAARHEALAVIRGEKATLGNFVYKPLAYSATEL